MKEHIEELLFGLATLLLAVWLVAEVADVEEPRIKALVRVPTAFFTVAMNMAGHADWDMSLFVEFYEQIEKGVNGTAESRKEKNIRKEIKLFVDKLYEDREALFTNFGNQHGTA